MDILMAIWALSILAFEVFIITLPLTLVICGLLKWRKEQRENNTL